MWREYSKSCLRHNRSASFSIMAVVLAASLFLSLLCSLAFNLWIYEVERIRLEEGDWHIRITAGLEEPELEELSQFANVEELYGAGTSPEGERIVEIHLSNVRSSYQDGELIAEHLGLGEEQIEYHETLLSRFFVTDPQDENPPLLLPFYAAVLLLVCVSLILIIRNSFELSMQSRIHQFGIFSSIGATPRQIRSCLLWEAAVLGIFPILLGTLLGIGLSWGVIGAVNRFAAGVSGRHPAVFHYHPAVFAVTAVAEALTVLLSAWIPARKLSRITPLEAVRYGGKIQNSRKKYVHLFPRPFGIVGELAANALRAQKKSMRIGRLSLLLSFLGFTSILCFFTLSSISTRYTYFERYQDAWDVMAQVKDPRLTDFTLTEQIKELSGARSVVLYQKVETACRIDTERQSEELRTLGGLEALAGERVAKDSGNYRVSAPILILDDESFLEYCARIGQLPGLEGAVVLNRIWDSANSNFRSRQYVPFVKEEDTIPVYTREGTVMEFPVLSYTEEPPLLREEYEDYALVMLVPLSLWERVSASMTDPEPEIFIRILGEEGIGLEECERLEAETAGLMDGLYEFEIENRIQERISNEEMIQGAQFILGGFCGLLALIGIANVFFNTLGFLRQRRREFARCLSVGMTPGDMKKMFFLEAVGIAGRPILITLPLTGAAAVLMVSASHLKLSVFLQEAPFIPVLAFALVIIISVAAAYAMGYRRIKNSDLGGILKDDTAG